jgi:hypothetical protein
LARAADVVANLPARPEDASLLERLKASPLFQTYAVQRRREFLESAPPTRI